MEQVQDTANELQCLAKCASRGGGLGAAHYTAPRRTRPPTYWEDEEVGRCRRGGALVVVVVDVVVVVVKVLGLRESRRRDQIFKLRHQLKCAIAEAAHFFMFAAIIPSATHILNQVNRKYHIIL